MLKKLGLTLINLCFALNCLATEIPARPEVPILDTTNTLTQPQIAELSKVASKNEILTSTVTPTLLVKTTDGESIGDYASRVAETWHPGIAGVDQAVVLVIAVQDKKWAIRTSRSTGVSFTDAHTKLVLNKMAEYLKAHKGDFYGAITLYYREIPQYFKPPAAVKEIAAVDEGTNAFKIVVLFLVLLGTAIVIAIIINNKAEEERMKRQKEALDREVERNKKFQDYKIQESKSIMPVVAPVVAAATTTKVVQTYNSNRTKQPEKKKPTKYDNSDYDNVVSTLSTLSSLSSSSESNYSSSSSSSYDWSSSSDSGSFDGGGSSGSFD